MASFRILRAVLRLQLSLYGEQRLGRSIGLLHDEGMAKFEVLATRVYAELRDQGVTNAGDDTRRLLDNYRKIARDSGFPMGLTCKNIATKWSRNRRRVLCFEHALIDLMDFENPSYHYFPKENPTKSSRLGHRWMIGASAKGHLPKSLHCDPIHRT